MTTHWETKPDSLRTPNYGRRRRIAALITAAGFALTGALIGHGQDARTAGDRRIVARETQRQRDGFDPEAKREAQARESVGGIGERVELSLGDLTAGLSSDNVQWYEGTTEQGYQLRVACNPNGEPGERVLQATIEKPDGSVVAWDDQRGIDVHDSGGREVRPEDGLHAIAIFGRVLTDLAEQNPGTM